ncbi:restriction endonuclease [Fusobacterium periodonticum]|uniref:McrC family protein n=1 Tax=Fusobacterium periodonticum TaxID=860 RepID=UPI0028D6A368|nr:restriction endonuclease [Fusobacterium periodonticum]
MEERIFTFREFQKIKNKKIYSKLKKYIDDNDLEDRYEFFKITKDSIVPQNFVGTIPLNDIQIEILPKIPLVENDIVAEKNRFLEILQNISYFKEKFFNDSKIAIADTSILEIFINLFIKEVEEIIEKGLLYRYIGRNENISVFKGKLDINNHIKYNFSHKEKFFMKFDEFSINSLENSIIKLTIQKLKKISVNLKNKEKLNKISHHFENIIILPNSIENLKYITFDRTNDYYKNSIQWSKIFLNNQSSSIFSATNGEVATMLFPMETIFENYIANKLINIVKEKFYNQLIVKVQDDSCSAFSTATLNDTKLNNMFNVKPDIVIKNKNSKEIFILDTKWKILDKLDNKFKISTDDIYQMLSYVKIYNDRYKNSYTCEKAYLIYPATNIRKNSFSSEDKIKFKTDNFELNICFVNLSSEETTEKDLVNILSKFIKEEGKDEKNRKI